MEHLCFEMWRKNIEIAPSGEVLEGDVIKKVFHFYIQRDDFSFIRKNEKTYTNFKSAYKALIQKVKKYGGTSYALYMKATYQTHPDSSQHLKMLTAYKSIEKPIIRLTCFYEHIPFATVNLTDGTVTNDYHLNEGNRLLEEWLPKTVERKPTPLQQEIKMFQAYNIQAIDMKNIRGEGLRSNFFSELRHCTERMNAVIPLMEFYPIERIYFSRFKKYRGIYKPSQIAFRPDIMTDIRSTIYHEYGHHFFDGGVYNLGDDRYYPNEYREQAANKMDEIISMLTKERTLAEIWTNAEWRMEHFPSPKKPHVHDYLTEHEEYLVRHTEIFARLFESYFLDKDHQKRESLSYKLRFTKEELDKAEPLLLSYLAISLKGYKEAKSVRR